MQNAVRQKWESVAAFGASAIVRLWPEETKDWGRAFAAELGEIESCSESLRWLLGGVMLLTRERFRHFLRSLGRPAGLGANNPLGPAVTLSRRLPRTPRVVTALLLLGSLAILVHPEVRASMDALTRELWNPEKWSTFRTVQRKAIETGDAKLLALLSLLHPENNERARLSNDAIARDASLTWLDYRYFRPADSPEEREQLRPAVRERNKRLQKWDPDNAIPRLIAAELLFEDILAALPEASSFHSKRAQELSALETTAAANAEWLATMDSAFRAPKYDTYALQRFELIRDIARQYQINDPDVTAYAVIGGALPQFKNVITYAHILLYRDSQDGKGAEETRAIADGWKILHFAERMQVRGRTAIEDVVATKIAQEACERLQTLLAKNGQRKEAAIVAHELERWTVALERIKERNRSWSASLIGGSPAWTGLTIHVTAYASIALLGVSLLSLGYFVGRGQDAGESRGVFPVLCSLAVDVAPPLLLFTCVVLFVAYHPYAHAYQSYFQTQAPSMGTESMENLAAAVSVRYMLPSALEMQSEFVTYLVWLSSTVALSTVAMFLVYRMWWQRRTT